MWFEQIKSYYKRGFYTTEQLKVFVPKFISEVEYKTITGIAFKA